MPVCGGFLGGMTCTAAPPCELGLIIHVQKPSDALHRFMKMPVKIARPAYVLHASCLPGPHTTGPACAELLQPVQETLQLEKTWTAVYEWDVGYAAVRGLLFAQLQLPALRAMGNKIAAILAMEGVDAWPVWQDVHVGAARLPAHLLHSLLPFALICALLALPLWLRPVSFGPAARRGWACMCGGAWSSSRV